ncbi:MAG: hypothetical protein V3U76_11330 [Granulosicoccus sp.]
MNYLIASLLGAASSMLIINTAQAQAENTDWPCIQVFVPEVSVAVHWPMEISEAELTSWRDNKEVADLAQKLGDLESYTDELHAEVATFAESLSEADQLPTLNRLAAGIVDVTNDRRSLFLKGIKRYTRQQSAIATKIEAMLNDVAAMDGTEQADSRAELQETLHWQERIYDQREQSIIALCDRPVELEQTLSEVLRDVAQYLP